MNIRNKIAICFFGVCSRSMKYTHHNHIKNIIDPIKQDFDYDIYVFNNNVGNIMIDNTRQLNDNINIIESNIYEEMTQIDIDKIIDEKISRDNIVVKMRFDYDETLIRNAMRQMFAEEQVGLFLEKNKNNYTAAIICNTDLYFLNKINPETIRNAISLYSSVYTTNVNDAQGYTNGFYIGSLDPLIKILKRFSILEKMLPTDKDYEYLLKKSFDINNITRIITEIDFVKIRSNKFIARQGRMSNSKYNHIINDIQIDINTIV